MIASGRPCLQSALQSERGAIAAGRSQAVGPIVVAGTRASESPASPDC